MRFLDALIFTSVFLAGCASVAITPNLITEESVRGVLDSQTLVRKEIGLSSSIRIPASWTLNSYYMPPELGASNIRITAEGVRIAITGMTTKAPVQPVENLRTALAGAGQAYLGKSIEKTSSPVTFSTATTHGAHASYTASDQSAGLPALANEKSLAVTSAVISRAGAMFTVTVSLNGRSAAAVQNYKVAVAALRTIE